MIDSADAAGTHRIALGGALGPGPASVLVTAPADDSGFTLHGRAGLLTELTDLVTGATPVVVLHGAGGHGKSAIARVLAERLTPTMPVWWVNAASPTTLADGLGEVALRSGADPTAARAAWAGRSSAPDLLWDTVNAHSDHWLLVLDDAEADIVDDGGWLPTPVGGGTILITTRDGRPDAWGDRATRRPVDALNESDGAAVLLDRAPDAGDPARLVERLGGHPLASRLAGAYLADAPANVDEYLNAWDDLGIDGDDPTDHAVALSLDLLADRGLALARPLLGLLSALAPAPIPDTLLDVEALAETEPFETITDAELERTLAGLTGLGLLEPRSGDHGSIRIAPLVREASRRLTEEDADEFRWISSTLLLMAIDADFADDPGRWPAGRALVPHCVPICVEPDLDDDHGRAVDLAIATGTTVTDIGLLGDGEWYFRRAVQLSDEADGPDHERTLEARWTLALHLHERGDLESAEREFRDVLARQTELSGADDADTLLTRRSLTDLLRDKGDLSTAEAAYRDLLRAFQRKTWFSGPEHAATQDIRRQLVKLKIRQGDLDFAEAELRAVLAIARGSGPENAETLAVRRELADLLLVRGDPAATDTEFRDILASQGRLLGGEHPATLGTRQGLAALLAHRGERVAAEREYREVLAIRERVLGVAHPATIATRRDLARLPDVSTRE